MTRGKAKQEFRARRRPDLPVDPPVVDGTDLFHGPEIAIARSTISELKREGLSATSLSIESCVLNRVALPDSTFATITLRDVRLVGCDLANVKTRALMALRVELLDCRMTGFRVEEPAECHDVLISQGLQSYSQFEGCIFRGCNLHNADMRGAKLKDADLRGSQVEGLRLHPADLYGAMVDPSQAMIFAALLGIRIR